ncbi:sensor histidine kinase [Clostridium sp. C105KSO13]|uniref:sensor histidine kinase n=1 Tax=Clostridium sp. C105KSO13 TaxID=1776045 RepID=UPI0007407FD7|nr:HAMP domain-containing sensor histidine kinase [Clostridium sp. C105KSO13]CUX40698.1 Alkaline phosphatase synthesis sensor protein PhoR [Clostridium sp. C105KSO13]
MDIKLKNSRRRILVFIFVLVITCSVGMVAAYPSFSRVMQSGENDAIYEQSLTDICRDLEIGNYILYNEVTGKIDRALLQEQYGNSRFDLLRKYMDYEVFDSRGTAQLGTSNNSVLKNLKAKDTSYAFRVEFIFQKDGEISKVQVTGGKTDMQRQYQMEQYLLDMEPYPYQGIEIPSGVQIVYGMTEEKLNAYIKDSYDSEYLSIRRLMESELYSTVSIALGLIVAVTAIFLAIKRRDIFEEKRIFAAPFEIVVTALGILAGLGNFVAEMVLITINARPNALGAVVNFAANTVMWFVVFGIVFWGFVCLGAMFTMKKAYWTERTLCAGLFRWLNKRKAKYGRGIKKKAGEICNRTKHFCGKQYDMLLHLDFQDKTNRTILKIVVLNLVVLLIICSMWFYGIAALVIYSIVLFFFFKKYFKDIQSKYKLLLQATNRLAEGDLDSSFEADIGVFNPVQEELKKIQTGFKKAVEEEVKSERMKTELITNVSHDLKTPLTAIITYTDLLKTESDEEKRKEYIQILEQKSLRLKGLIEDLFEISKAASNNVTMNFMSVDIVDLLKQVGLEYDSKIKETNLDFRWSLPDHKIILWLDSQKTYRIFENLIVNITKYAMPHTRVYVEMNELDDQVHISMKNVSAEELDFNSEEITDRFVRGDISRNTEGSGLGLAIAKSFAKLQHGTLKISTDADLYKVEITFPRKG